MVITVGTVRTAMDHYPLTQLSDAPTFQDYERPATMSPEEALCPEDPPRQLQGTRSERLTIGSVVAISTCRLLLRWD